MNELTVRVTSLLHEIAKQYIAFDSQVRMNGLAYVLYCYSISVSTSQLRTL